MWKLSIMSTGMLAIFNNDHLPTILHKYPHDGKNCARKLCRRSPKVSLGESWKTHPNLIYTKCREQGNRT